MFPVATVCGNTMIMKPVCKARISSFRKWIFLFD